MKRKIVLLLFMAFSFSHSIFAQQGRHGIGVAWTGCGIFDEPTSMGIAVKYQYGLTGILRIEPYFNYNFYKTDFKTIIIGEDSKKFPRLSAGLNLHALFYKGNRLWTYVFAGASYSQMRYLPYIEKYNYYDSEGNEKMISPEEWELSENKFGGNFGLGADFRASYDININIELGYNTLTKSFASVGIVYNFKIK